MTLFMLTIKATSGFVAHQMSGLIKWFKSQDSHYWIVALEHGASGYTHFQVRGDSRYSFADLKRIFPKAHIEETKNRCEYERKEGCFICSDDTRDVLRVRFGKLSRTQQEILDTVETQSIREIDCWLDPRGNHGKSWLSIHLHEQGKALVVPRYCFTARGISQFICSSYTGQQYIIFDVPRAGKIPQDIYEALEAVKDGLVHDERYSGRCRDVRGAKLIVFTNRPLDTRKLSDDRWRLHGISG